VVLTPSTIWQRLSEDWLALPFWTGFRGLVLSPGKSLFLYSPWLLLAVPGTWLFWRRHGRDGALVVWLPLLVVLLYSKKLVWHGGSWGPRYMLPVVPLLALAALPAIAWCLAGGRARRVALAGLFALSVGVQLIGIGKDPEQYPSMAREFVVPALPDYGTRLGGYDYWLARGGPELSRALQHPSPGSTERGLGYVWGYPTADLRIDVRERRQLSLAVYFVDWDHAERRQAVTVEDALGRRVLDLNRDFSGGLWATWQVEVAPGAPLRIGLEQRGADTAVISAVAFSPPSGERRDVPILDEGTKGNWRGMYGADGYVLLAWHSFSVDEASLPSYVLGYEATHVGDKPDPRIHVDVAEGDLRDTPLLYAPPFSPLLGNAWLLAADLSHLVLPSRPDVTGAILARPPWRWFGVAATQLPHPEYGLGLDFWPTLLYTNYASHLGVLVAMWVVLLAVEALLVVAAARVASDVVLPGVATRWGLPALVLALVLFDWLHVRP
jgi:hypothetical protein